MSTVELAIQKHDDLRARRADGAMLRRAFEALDVAVVALDVDGEVHFMNRAATEILGSGRLEVLGARPPWAVRLRCLSPTERDERPCRVPLDGGARGTTCAMVREIPLSDGGAVCIVERADRTN